MTNTPLAVCPHCEMNLAPYHDPSRPLRFCIHCHFPLLEIAGKYRLIDVLGKGGFGTVYRAQHTLIKRDPDRVIKVLKPDLIDKPGMKPRFLREVQLTSILSQHNPHIVRVFDDFGEVPDLGYFYVMEYLRGLPLTHFLRQTNAALPFDWSLEVFGQICDAMQSAHNEGIVHRDLKPDNVMLISLRGRDNFVKIIDFGIAKPLLSETLRSGSLEISTKGILGTPFYIAPEQATNQQIGPHTDLYAMAILLHEMLTGELPLIPPQKRREITLVQILQMRLEYETMPPPSQAYPHLHLPHALDAIFQKALHRNPHKRYRSAEAFWNAIAPFYQGEAPPPTFASKPLAEPDGPSYALTRPQEQAIDNTPTLVADAFRPSPTTLESSAQSLSQSDILSTHQAPPLAYAATLAATDLDALDFKKTEPSPLPTPFDEHTFLGENRPTQRKPPLRRAAPFLLLLALFVFGGLSALFLRTHLSALFHPTSSHGLLRPKPPDPSTPSHPSKPPDPSAPSHPSKPPDPSAPSHPSKPPDPNSASGTTQRPDPSSVRDIAATPRKRARRKARSRRPSPEARLLSTPRPAHHRPTLQPTPSLQPPQTATPSLCPSTMRFVRITPFRPKTLSLHLRPHATPQMHKGGVCIPALATMIILDQTGFHSCQVSLPSALTTIHLRLREQEREQENEPPLDPTYCLRR
ncbi:protein kinase [Myxococcota bacterium]|nr:protein kinase [Myxococcota bacterium]